MTGPKNLTASVHARLLARAKAEKRPFDEVLTYYAIERFLFRLSRTAHRDRFVLKGALMLPLWGTSIARATRDIDFLGRGTLTVEEVGSVIRDCLAVEAPPDAINFDATTLAVDEIREDTRYGGIRATFLGYLERARINMQVDVGRGDAVTPGVVTITYPVLLGLPAPELVAYPVETTIAEKLEAVVDLGLTNSRMKDFFDLWSLLGNLELEGETMTTAVNATFTRRGTEIPTKAPVGLTEQFARDRTKLAQWSAFTGRLRIPDPPDLVPVTERIAAFAMPVFTAIGGSTHVANRWLAARGWRA